MAQQTVFFWHKLFLIHDDGTLPPDFAMFRDWQAPSQLVPSQVAPPVAPSPVECSPEVAAPQHGCMRD